MKRLQKLLAVILVCVGFLVIRLWQAQSVYAKNTFAAYEQIHFRFGNDTGGEASPDWKAAEDTDITGQAKEENFRVRIKTQANNHDQSETISRKLQYKVAAGTCADGSWTDITTTVDSNHFVISLSDNFGPDPTDTTEQLSSAGGVGFVAGELLESTQSTAADVVDNAETEDEWNLQATANATDSETYMIRLIESDDTAYTTYTVCPQLTIAVAAVPTFTLNSYRWYVDSDAEDVTDPWGNPNIAQDTAITITPVSNDPPNSSQELRLRVNFTVNTTDLPADDTAFKLQFKANASACTDATGWTEVGASQAWEFATSSVGDGTILTMSRLSPISNVLEEYKISSPTGNNPNSATTGEEIEYDFHIVGTNISSATQYSLRVIESDNTVFDAYTNCPTLTTEPGTGDFMRHGASLTGGTEHGFFWAD